MEPKKTEALLLVVDLPSTKIPDKPQTAPVDEEEPSNEDEWVDPDSPLAHVPIQFTPTPEERLLLDLECARPTRFQTFYRPKPDDPYSLTLTSRHMLGVYFIQKYADVFMDFHAFCEPEQHKADWTLQDIQIFGCLRQTKYNKDFKLTAQQAIAIHVAQIRAIAWCNPPHELGIDVATARRILALDPAVHFVVEENSSDDSSE